MKGKGKTFVFYYKTKCLFFLKKFYQKIRGHQSTSIKPYFIHHTFIAFTSVSMHAACTTQFTLLYPIPLLGKESDYKSMARLRGA
jgi:hypothetical protein